MEIPLFKIYWDKDDTEAVNTVIERGAYWTTGSTSLEFEEALSRYIGTKYCVTFNSGTSALHAALLAHGIAKNDEVIVPSFTFISTANAPIFVDAKPVFADIEQRTFGLDPESVNECITSKTKAIVPVHYAGCPCKIRELRDIAEENNIIMIEDAAESFGAATAGEKVGTFGDAAMLSFCQNKIITTGEGGAIVTNSKECYERLRLICSHGRLEQSNYFGSSGPSDYVRLGYNFRMSDITAALGISQLRKVDTVIEMRRKNADYLSCGLSGLQDLEVLRYPEELFHVYQLFTVWIHEGKVVRDAMIKRLAEDGIISKVYFPPVHLTTYYRDMFGLKEGELPITESVADHVLTLPIYPSMQTCEMDYVIATVRKNLCEM
jgi:perosamine synthetase